MCEKRSRNVDFPPVLLDLDDATDDQVADFRCVARAEREYGEEFVGFEDGASEGCGDGRVEGGVVGAMASTRGPFVSRVQGQTRGLLGPYLIHCDSSVMVSPGTTVLFEASFMRFAGRSSSSMEASLSALESPLSGEVAEESSSKLGGRIVMPILDSTVFALQGLLSHVCLTRD